MKKYYADVRTKPNFPERDFSSIEVKTEEFQGYISLITVKNVISPWFVPRENRENECILDNGYHWIAIYPKNKKYAVTAMINARNEIVEWYFDMVARY